MLRNFGTYKADNITVGRGNGEGEYMSAITISVGEFAAKAAQMGSLATKKLAKKPVKKPVKKRVPARGLARFYCLRRLRALRRTTAARSGGSYRMFFSGGSRFSVRMPRVSIRSRRARKINKVCEAVVREAPKTAVAER